MLVYNAKLMVYIKIRVAAKEWIYEGSTSLSADMWFHVAFTWRSAGNLVVYQDGEPVGTVGSV